MSVGGLTKSGEWEMPVSKAKRPMASVLQKVMNFLSRGGFSRVRLINTAKWSEMQGSITSMIEIKSSPARVITRSNVWPAGMSRAVYMLPEAKGRKEVENFR